MKKIFDTNKTKLQAFLIIISLIINVFPVNPIINVFAENKIIEEFNIPNEINGLNEEPINEETKYTITTEVTVDAEGDKNGTISPSETDLVSGENYELKVIANEGYAIESLIITPVYGQNILDAENKNTYDFTIEGIDKNYTINVVFKKVYNISFALEGCFDKGKLYLSENVDNLEDDLIIENESIEQVDNGESFGVIIVVDYGYEIFSVKNNEEHMSFEKIIGPEIEDAEETIKKTYYKLNIDSVTDNHNITIKFVEKQYSIKFLYNSNGILLNDENELDYIVISDEEETEVFGSVLMIQEGNNKAISFIPNEHFYVSEIKMKISDKDESPITIDIDNDENVTKDSDGVITYVFNNVENNYVVEVLFEIDKFEIEFDISGDGKVEVNNNFISGEYKESFEYGGELSFQLKPDSNKFISSFDIDGTEIEVTDINLTLNNLLYKLSDIDSTHKIKVVFGNIVEVDNINNDYYIKAVSTGELRKSYTTETGVSTLVFSNNANVKIKPVSPYSLIKCNELTDIYSDNLEITETKEISNIMVKSMTGLVKDSLKIVTPHKLRFILDKQSPVIGTISKNPITEWTNDEINITIPVTDEGESGIAKIKYSNNPDEYSSDTFSLTDVNDSILIDHEYTITIPNDKDLDEVYYIWVYDNAGNKSGPIPTSIYAKIDITAPVIESISKSPDTEWSKDTVFVQGEVSDEGGSQISKVYFSNNLSDYESLSSTNSAFEAELVGEKYSFSITNAKSLHEIYYVWSYDIAGNKSEYKEIDIWIDIELPVITSLTKSPESEWSDKEVVISVEVADNPKEFNSGIAGIRYNIKDDYDSAIEVLEDSNIFKFTTLINDTSKKYDFNGIYYVWTFDKVGNISKSDSIEIKIDTKEPIITSFELKHSITNTVVGIINFHNFGIYYNKPVSAKITASDGEISSGIDSITLFGDGKEIETKKIDKLSSVTFDINPHFMSDLTVIATDNLGHKSKEASPYNINEKLKSSRLILDDIIPSIKIETSDYIFKDLDGKAWYAAATDFDIDISDDDSGINEVNIDINGVTIETDKNNTPIKSIITEEEIQINKRITLSSNQGKTNKDGSYDINVAVKDYSGNENIMTSKIYYDSIAPQIMSIEFFENSIPKNINKDKNDNNYSAFFSEEVKVHITAKDMGSSSGIKSIIYNLVNVQVDGSLKTSYDTSLKVDENGKASFILPENFKGYIIARVIDNVENKSEDYKSARVISEDITRYHNKDESFLELPETKFIDKDDVHFYANNTTLNIRAASYYSGLSKVELTITSENSIINEIIDISNKNSTDISKNNWIVNKTDLNLVTEIEKLYQLNFESDNIIVNLKTTDNIGNISEKTVKLSIDKTIPVIQFTFDNNDFITVENSVSGTKNIFKVDRIATVIVTDKNFDPKTSIIKVDSSYGGTPSVGEWTLIEKNKNELSYSSKILFDRDGEYALNIEAQDLSGNKISKKSDGKFIIDKTTPRINISYSNENEFTRGFFNKDQILTISVHERNFDPAKVVYLGTGTYEGEKINFPTMSKWVHDDGVYSSRIVFSEDGEYSFVINATDDAGNIAEQRESRLFTVDKTNPKLEIIGVKNLSANNNIVKPIITYSDHNFVEENVEITLKASKRDNVKLEGLTSLKEKGGEFIFYDFKREKEFDDIYTLNAKITDKAGNISAQKIMFSINRFGSVYIFDESLKNIENKYINKEVDIIFTETNMDIINDQSIKIKLARNDIQTDLVKNKDYTISKFGGGDVWTQNTYTISKDLFKREGKYSIYIYSTDGAGNVNENINESKEAGINFGIDKTKPIIMPINFNNDVTYAESLKNVEISVNDNLVLGNVDIFLNDKKVDYKTVNDMFKFDIHGSNTLQNVKVVANDAAGNSAERYINNFYVTTSLFIRWSTNQPIFLSTIVGASIVSLGSLTFIVFRKKF